MKRIYKYPLINRIFYYLISSVTILILVIALLHGFRAYTNYHKELKDIEHNTLERQKKQLRENVDKIHLLLEEVVNLNTTLDEEHKLEETQLQDYMLVRLSQIKYGNNGYYFGSGMHGEPLFSDGKVTRGSANIWEMSDPEGVKIIQKQHEAFTTLNGVFVNYRWEKPGQETLSRKISFTKAFEDWNWVIGTGVYYDDVADIIKQRGDELKRDYYTRIIEYSILLLIYLFLSFLLINHMSNNIKTSITSLVNYFKAAEKNIDNLDMGKIAYPEFKKIARSANSLIEKRRDVENELKLSIIKYKQLIETTSEGFWMIDPDAKTVEVNESLCKMIGYSPDEIIGKSPEIFMDDNNKTIFRDNHFQKRSTPHLSFEIEFITKSQKIIPCFARSTKLYDDNNNVFAHFAFISDITQQREYENKMTEYNALLEQQVRDRTKELKKNNEELLNFNKLFVGRELRIKELKVKVRNLEKQIHKLKD